MKEKKRPYRSPSRERSVDVGLDDFEDDEIKEEFAHRFGLDGTVAQEISDEEEPVTVAGARLREIGQMLRLGRSAEALRAADDLIRDALGTAL